MFKKFYEILIKHYANDKEVLAALKTYKNDVKNAKTETEIKKANRKWYNSFCLDDLAEDISIGMMVAAVEEFENK